MSDYNTKYDDNKKDDKLYERVSTSGKENELKKTELFFTQEITLKEKTESGTGIEFNVIDEVVLRLREKSRIKLSCWLLRPKDSSHLSWISNAIHITRRTKTNNVYSDEEITLVADEARKLASFIDKHFGYDKQIIDSYLSSKEFNKSNLTYSKDEILEILSNQINEQEDVINILNLKRKKTAILKLEEIINGNYNHETDITSFLSKNPWLFGSEYIIISNLTKINSENILDLAPKTLDSFIDIVEVKLPNVKLLNLDMSHNNYYPTSHLSRAIAQVINYIKELETQVEEKYLNDSIEIIRPNATILIGSEEALNNNELKALRLINSSLHNIRIITYQQLLENAKNSIK